MCLEFKKLYAWLDTIAREFCDKEREGICLEFKKLYAWLDTIAGEFCDKIRGIKILNDVEKCLLFSNNK